MNARFEQPTQGKSSIGSTKRKYYPYEKNAEQVSFEVKKHSKNSSERYNNKMDSQISKHNLSIGKMNSSSPRGSEGL